MIYTIMNNAYIRKHYQCKIVNKLKECKKQSCKVGKNGESMKKYSREIETK